MIEYEIHSILMALFLFFSCGVLIITGLDIIRKGLGCASAFRIAWVFAYSVPTFLYLLDPGIVRDLVGYDWMGPEEWALATLVAFVGFLSFQLGYRLGDRRGSSQGEISQEPPGVKGDHRAMILLALGLGLQLYPLYLFFSRSIRVDFVHRGLHWQEVGLTIRFAYFSLPTTAIALWLFLRKRSLLRLFLLLVTVTISLFSAISLGARMFVVLLPIVIFMVYTDYKPRFRPVLFASLSVMVIALSVGYYLYLRTEDPGQVGSGIAKVMLTDIGRSHTLAYTAEHASLTGSDLVEPPILGSYFYWAILPIPRSVWSGKPYATNLQFSHSFRAEYTPFFVPFDIAEMRGATEFGFIDESMMNLGLFGMLILIVFGFLAARLDVWIKDKRHLRVAIPIGFLLGTIYAFNGILNYLMPFLVLGFLLDVIWRDRARSQGAARRSDLQGEVTL